MRHLLSIFAALCILSAPAAAQTLKALMYNTTNGNLVYNSLSSLRFTNEIVFAGGNAFLSVDSFGTYLESDNTNTSAALINFVGDGADRMARNTRANLGFSTNLNTLWTATNAANASAALSLGSSDSPTFEGLTVNNLGSSGSSSVVFAEDSGLLYPLSFGATLTNLGISPNNSVSFANITIRQTAATNGLLYVYRTNNEPFLGLANLIASNNTTVSNETLFRVGVAEATNRAAQFGFRSTNTNGNGVAVFSVFGYNALMQIGADALTNAVIFSGGGTNNEVMTLIKNGATEFARPIAFSTTAHAAATRTNLALGATSDPTFRDVSVRDLSIVGGSGGKIVYPSTNTAPANTTNVAAWIQVNVGTNAYRVPLYQ